MKRAFGIALMLAGCLNVAPRLCAQAPAPAQGRPAKDTQKPAAPPVQAAPQPVPQGGGNPFPGDTTNVPVLPSTPGDVPSGAFSDSENSAASLPSDDLDPVRSPDGLGAAGSDPAEESSSSSNSLDSLLPKPGDEESGRRKRKSEVPDHQETAKEDISVAKYYMDNKNWKAAQSRFQSALVLAPEDPDVYWGLAESARHLGDFADARANYQKVVDYDPDGKHAKEAQKILKDPEIANAKAASAPQ